MSNPLPIVFLSIALIFVSLTNIRQGDEIKVLKDTLDELPPVTRCYKNISPATTTLSTLNPININSGVWKEVEC